MVRSQKSYAGGEVLGIDICCFLVAALPSEGLGKVVAAGEGIGMVRSEETFSGCEDFGVQV